MEERRPLSRLISVASIMLLPIATVSCGFAFVHGPPAGHRQMDSFHCTRGNAGPIADVALSGVGVGLAVWAAHQGHYDSYYYYVSEGIAAAAIAAAVLYGSSAVVGFLKTKKCRAATQQIGERLGQDSKDNLVVTLYAAGLRGPAARRRHCQGYDEWAANGCFAGLQAPGRLTLLGALR